MSVVLYLNCDLARIGDWCTQWGMLVNPVKTNALLILRTGTLAPIFPNLMLDAILVERVIEMMVLTVILKSKTIVRLSYPVDICFSNQ